MIEFIGSLVLVSIGYLLGFFMGWTDGRKTPYRQRVTTPSSKQKPPMCQDYSHLKKKLF